MKAQVMMWRNNNYADTLASRPDEAASSLQADAPPHLASIRYDVHYEHVITGCQVHASQDSVKFYIFSLLYIIVITDTGSGFITAAIAKLVAHVETRRAAIAGIIGQLS